MNTAVRPSAEEFAFAIPEATLRVLCQLLGEGAEVLAHVPSSYNVAEMEARRDGILALLARRPCTIDDITKGLHVHQNEVVKHLESLLAKGVFKRTNRDRIIFFEPAH